jgi:membrane protein
LLSLAGRNGDQLVPGRALNLITIGGVLQTVRRDEDRVVDRLPAGAMPVQLCDLVGQREDVSFAELLAAGEDPQPQGSAMDASKVSGVGF